MKVAVDAQLAVGTATGIGEYVGGLVTALQSEGLDVVPLCEPNVDPWRFDRRLLWDQVLLPRRARVSGADILHCASGTVPLRAGMPIVATVHDVAWLRAQSHARFYARWYFGRFSLARYRCAAGIAVDSEFSRRELLCVLPECDPKKIRVVYPGVATDFFNLQRAGGDGRTIAVIGTIERRKNLALLVRALPRLPGARIVAVGPPTPYLEQCRRLAERLGVEDRLEFRGYVERAQLLSLYACCAVVAVPSLYEGFGYAAAQALCAGVPCVVSDRGALAEIAGSDACVVSPDNDDGWLQALASALSGDMDVRASMARTSSIARFGWRSSVGAMTALYRDALIAK